MITALLTSHKRSQQRTEKLLKQQQQDNILPSPLVNSQKSQLPELKIQAEESD